MISKVQENIIFSCWFKNFLRTFSFNSCLISLKNTDKNFRSNIFSRIINFNSCIDIYSWLFVSRFIKDFPLERITSRVGNIIICEGNNILRIKFIFSKKMVSMEDISLMPIVGIGIWSCYENSPIGRCCKDNKKG